jgi:hypothetical protein
VALSVLVALAACKGKDQPSKIDPFKSRPPTMTQVEIQRGEDACSTYVKQVCECAETRAKQPATAGAVDSAADLAEQCKLASALPEAMKTSLSVLSSADLSRNDALQAQDTAKKIAAECITQTAKLVSRGCNANGGSANGGM